MIPGHENILAAWDLFDYLFTAISISASHIILPRFVIVLIRLSASDISGIAREWFGAISALFGLAAATIAFVSAVVERPEFRVLSPSSARCQFWGVFRDFLIALLLATIWSACLAVLPVEILSSQFVQLISGYLTMLSILLLVKFTWTLNQIIAVRAHN